MASDQENSDLSDITDRLISEFDKNYLPSYLHTLRRLLFKTQIDKSKVVDAVKVVIEEVRSIWEGTSIKLQRVDHCHRNLHKLYDSYTELRKFQNKSQKVTEFLGKMYNVFDVSQDDSIKILSSLNDKVKNEFLSKPVECIKNRISMLRCSEMSGK